MDLKPLLYYFVITETLNLSNGLDIYFGGRSLDTDPNFG